MAYRNHVYETHDTWLVLFSFGTKIRLVPRRMDTNEVKTTIPGFYSYVILSKVLRSIV